MEYIFKLKPKASVTIGDTVFDSDRAIVVYGNFYDEARKLLGDNIARVYTEREFMAPMIQHFKRGYVHLNPQTLNQQKAKPMTTSKEISTKKPETALTRAGSEVTNILATIEEQVKAKEENYTGMVHDAKDPEGYETCREVCKELRPLRANIEKVRKALKAPITALGKQVDSGSKGLIERVDALIEPAQTAYREEDARKEREEEERKEKAQNAMNWMRDLSGNAMLATSEKIKDMIAKLEEKQIEPELFQELIAEAESLKEHTLQSLKMALQLKEQAEEQQRQLEEQQKQIAEMQRQQQASEPQQEEVTETKASTPAEEEKPSESVTEPETETTQYLTKPGKPKAPAKKVGYEPLAQWPSDQDRADSDQLNDICNKLEEAEEYIEYLHKNINTKVA